MLKKCLINCWIGEFPEYFKLWEKSCSKNEDYDFFVFTDQAYISNYKNIIIINKTLDELNMLFSKKLEIKIEIQKAYKLCDFRPAYGKIFEEYIKNYDFWGYCDLDQIFGDISYFITDEILKKYDKINRYGHFSLYRNTALINSLYKKEGATFSYIDVFKSKENYAFDEISGIDRIAKKNKVKTIDINSMADIDVKHKRYLCVNNLNYEKQIYTWEYGKVFKYYIENDKIQKQEKMYLHFQKKKPLIKINENKSEKYLIGENGVMKFEEISEEIIDKINPIVCNEKIENILYYKKKILDFLNCSTKQKYIWIKQKIVGR